LITCTNGQLGSTTTPTGLGSAARRRWTRAPLEPGELQRAAIVAGFSRVITLGYDDSGMKGWPQNDAAERPS
jgi:LmbE family N-acetylglucosaminyl deacetylase